MAGERSSGALAPGNSTRRQEGVCVSVAAEHRIKELPILILLPHNRCNCRCLMCDIWKIRQVREIRKEDLDPHLAGLRALKVKWVVFSGGEPLMHSDLSG